MWKEQAEALFFVEHLTITDIAIIVKKSRKTVSNYLNSLESYKYEMQWRRQRSIFKKSDYNKLYKQRYNEDKEILKKCHNEAVAVLSYEKY